MANLTNKRKIGIRGNYVAAAKEALISNAFDFHEDEEVVVGPLVDRLHEFEELGLEPNDIRELMNKIDKLQDEKAMRRIEEASHYGITMSERADRKMIDDILDRVAKEKNISLSIFMGKDGTNIAVYPYLKEDIPDIERLNRDMSCEQCCYNCEPDICRRCHYKSHFERYGTY